MDADESLTEEPLSAGNWAVLHLGSFAMEFACTTDQFMRIQPDLDRLAEKISGKRRPKRLRAAADWFSLRSHEQDHINRLVGTSFGFLLETVRSQWIHSTGQVLTHAFSRNAPLLPLGSVPRPDGLLTEDHLAALGHRTESWDSERTLCQGLSDCLKSLFDHVSGSQFISALWGLTSGRRDRIRYLLNDAQQPGSSGFSFRTPDNQPIVLTTRHILELFAWREQGNSLLDLGYDLRDVVDLFMTRSYEYQLAFEAWKAVVPQARSLVQNEGLTEKLIWGESFPFELFACADLALWPPFIPPGRIDSGYRWYDLNPARRFMTILAALTELEIPLTPARDETLNEKLIDLQNRLCQRLNWPTPQSLAEQWLGYLERELANNSSPWIQLEPEHAFRAPSAVAILRERVRRPAQVILNHIHLDTQGTKGSPIWVFQEPHGGKSFITFQDPPTRYLNQALFYEGTAHLHAPNRPLINGIREEWMASLTGRAVARIHQKLQNWSEENTLRLLHECKRYFQPI